MSADIEDSAYKRLLEKSPQPTWIVDREALEFLAVDQALGSTLGHPGNLIFAQAIYAR